MVSPDSVWGVGTPDVLNALRMAQLEDDMPWHVLRFVGDFVVALLAHLVWLAVTVDAFQIRTGVPDGSWVEVLYGTAVGSGLLSYAGLFAMCRAPLEVWLHLYTLHTGDHFRTACTPLDTINTAKVLLNVWSAVMVVLAVGGGIAAGHAFPAAGTANALLVVVVVVGAVGIAMLYVVLARVRRRNIASSTRFRLQPFSNALLKLPGLVAMCGVSWIGWAVASRAGYPHRPSISVAASEVMEGRGSVEPFGIDVLQLVFHLATGIAIPAAAVLLLRRIARAVATQKAFNAGGAAYPMGGGGSWSFPAGSASKSRYEYFEEDDDDDDESRESGDGSGDGSCELSFEGGESDDDGGRTRLHLPDSSSSSSSYDGYSS
ncbi:uncharacterized protein AMSG_01610 [Thecamonas trahens ATCC 50062]|uniref:Uncharacterized protein n=1 Tax=Thecamonas trahens ATCC 50062 TaxID=461836 RepID=A0A0L0DR25_THETB|nr:hypothetical protein AMSG_01610 [Thecamonas trahens ATCC 50062]KNC54759.1 hypothetical protein AMSG_01610 [Thecamonas trahens ATCC 50062]|eukprot:XP_013761659.1 hypothetical protein AMSG_01610 [Thecamonas trahens ATCC 50062]